jgi:hypothetical protein
MPSGLRARPPGRIAGSFAAALDVSYESYVDIETYDGEISSVISFRDAVNFAELVELDLRRVFGADDAVVTFAELAAAVRARLAETTLEELENEVGWELGDPITDPAAFGQFSLDGLADVATPFGLDWRHLLPLTKGH